jgi:hypothetical protein
MNLELKMPPTVKEQSLVFPPHLMAKFERADRQLRELYGRSPGVLTLVRLWHTCGTTAQIRKEFERAVLDIEKSTLTPNEEGDFDEDCL